MRIILLSSLLPLVLYAISYLYASYRARLKGEMSPTFFSYTFLNAFMLSLILAVIFFGVLYIYSASENVGNDYSSPAQKLLQKPKR